MAARCPADRRSRAGIRPGLGDRAGELQLVSSPVQFDVAAPDLSAAPEFAAQTEEILQELGLDWEQILSLKSAGAVT